MMKKVFFALAVAGMFGFAACGNNNATEETVDTMAEAIEAVVEENTTDSTAVEAVAEEAAEATETVAQ